MSLYIATRIAGVLALTLSAANAYAGTYLESTRISLQDPKAAPQVAKIWVDGNRLRTQTDADGHYAIFKDDALYVVDPAKKSYMVLDRATLAQLSERMAGLRAQLQSRLAALPPDQRAQIEKMMGPAAGTGTPPAAQSVQQTSRTDAAAGISCTVWDVNEAGVKVRELCVAPVAAVPGGADLMALMKTFVAAIKQMTSSFGTLAGNDLLSQAWSNFTAMDGVPLVTRTFAGGVATAESKLTSIRSESIPSSTFEVPADYTSRALFPTPNGAP